jgi:hypothetical protein
MVSFSLALVAMSFFKHAKGQDVTFDPKIFMITGFIDLVIDLVIVLIVCMFLTDILQ